MAAWGYQVLAPLWVRICDPRAHLGFALDSDANQANSTRISAARSKPVLCIAADEEAVMRELVENALTKTEVD